MKYNNTHSWFTLVELIVSITIFGIMMISVVSIFLFSSQMSNRVELNRVMQENIKNVMEDIAENVRKGKIRWAVTTTACPIWVSSPIPTSWSAKIRLCLEDAGGGDIEYMIGSKDLISGDWLPVSNLAECESFVKTGWISENDENICRVIKLEGWERYPLTNSFVAIEKLNFYITNDIQPKVTVSLTLRPAIRKWVAPDLVRLSTVQVQTTLSERLIETN